MKPMLWLALPLMICSGLAQAHDRGDRMERRWDERGDHIDHRLDLRSGRQLALGHEHRAYALDRKGDRIDAYFDRIGARHEARFDRHH